MFKTIKIFPLPSILSIPSLFNIFLFNLSLIRLNNASCADDQGDKASQHCLAALESIDDELDEVGIPAVKMADKTEARQYGVKSFPSVIVFVKRVPELYPGKGSFH